MWRHFVNFFNSMCYFNTFGSYPIAATVSELYFSNFWNLIVVSPFHFLLSNTIQSDFLAKGTCCTFVEKVQCSLFIYCCDCLASHPKSICMEGNVNVDSNLPYLSKKNSMFGGDHTFTRTVWGRSHICLFQNKSTKVCLL